MNKIGIINNNKINFGNKKENKITFFYSTDDAL